MPIPRFIPLQGGAKHLRIEHVGGEVVPNPPGPHWRIWINANGEFSLGTFLELYPSGSCYRVTWTPDGLEHRFEVTE
jgi:hypothetical protein